MPGTHFAVVLSEEEIAAIADAAIGDLADRLARRAFRPLGQEREAAAQTTGPQGQAQALASLHALIHLRQAVERQADLAAQNAARAGAGYPQLGLACNISRQGARRRWPGLVPNRTQPHHPRPSTDRSR
jgi:hypothetical protein